jgi:parvulin-like peptidyl-prolyl isomerase
MKLASLLIAASLAISSFAQLGSDTFMDVNGEKLTVTDFYRRMQFLPGLGRQTPQGFQSVNPGFATIDALLTEMVLLQVAKDRGVAPKDVDVDREIASRIKRQPTLLEDWRTAGRTDAEYRQQIKVGLAQYNLTTEGIIVTDLDVKNLYDVAKKDRFMTSGTVDMRLIMVTDEKTKKLVDADLKAGKSFADTATKYSTDDSKKVGGDYGTIPLTLLAPKLKAVVEKLKAGQTTDWIASESASFAKFLVSKVTPEVVQPLTKELTDELRREIALRKGQQKNDLVKVVREARAKAKVSISDPSYDKVFQELLKQESGVPKQ